MFVGYQSNTSVGASSAYIWTTKYLTNSNIRYDATTGIFSFVQPGWYEITFSTNAAGTGNIVPTMYVGGVASTYATAAMTSASATDFHNGSFSTVIYVQSSTSSGYATVQFVNDGVAATVDSSNLIIRRIG